MSKSIRLGLAVIVLLLCLSALYFVKLRRDAIRDIHGAVRNAFASIGVELPLLSSPSSTPISKPTPQDYPLMGQAALAEKVIAARVVNYYVQHGSLPQNIEEAESGNQVHAPGAAAAAPTSADPWGRPYVLLKGSKGRFFILSGGPSNDTGLTPDEQKTLAAQPVGRVYWLGGKIVFIGDVSLWTPPNSSKGLSSR